MTGYRPVDSKREEYRKYLERAGVMECLTRVLVSLYEEQDKGIDALEYVRTHLVENHPAENSSEEELKAQVARLLSENNMLRKRLSHYEEVPPPDPVKSPSTSQPKKNESVSDNPAQSKTSMPSKGNDNQSERQSSTGSTQKD